MARKRIVTIKDPGTAAQFKAVTNNGNAIKASATGGLRQVNDPSAGRYDLIPAECLERVLTATPDDLTGVLLQLTRPAELDRLLSALAQFAALVLGEAGSVGAGVHRLAVHYANGAKKYDDRNWEKGLETGRLVDSMLRHDIKRQQGLTDEDHLAAVVWNAFALMWMLPRIDDGRLPMALDTYGLVT